MRAPRSSPAEPCVAAQDDAAGADRRGLLGRRSFLYAGGAAAALVAGFPLVQTFGARDEARPWRPGPYGPLRPDPDGRLDLPEGFSYRVLSRTGTTMSDGLRVPARPDGMACFTLPDGSLALLRNHENPAHVGLLGPWTDGVAPESYSREGMGGVTRVVLDAATLEVRSCNLVLGGTTLNCAGGPSPWGWLTCEEDYDARHGLVFACDPTAARIAPPQPIRGYGRFRHEAACVDPRTSIAYLTEDREDSCLYRFVPHDPARPFDGELQALAIRGRPRARTGTGLRAGERLEIAWVPVRDPDPGDDVLRHLAQQDGAASFVRGEGMAFDPERGAVVFAASAGGPNANGQLFRVEPEGDGGELVLLAQSEGSADFDMPDNLVVAPNGVVFFCEDGRDRNYVRAIGTDGRVFDFARNTLSRSELAGVCFSPDGRAMFVSLQTDGLTLAITGPFAHA
ncbi:alkaline phosphatase PhoX [Sandaracinus amylolyticus]|uniref:alkaline phosphatase PhoX n=1 Tax=Sandaracinus amylolyticus TaxID=927083 RepID=UPI001F48EF67|nr:alkaline phosphatase PhoX [Sandaracinus amylolyticus]